MPFFMPLMLTPEKRNAFFPQLLCTASMFGLSLYLKIAIRIGPAMSCVTELNSLHLQIFRFFIVWKKLFRISAASVFENSPYSQILYYIYYAWFIQKYILYIDFQNSLSVTLLIFKFL